MWFQKRTSQSLLYADSGYVSYCGYDIPYTIVPSKHGLKRMKICIRQGQVEVRIPAGSGLERVAPFVQEKASWIHKHVMRFELRALGDSRSPAYRFQDDEVFYLFGKPLRLCVVRDGLLNNQVRVEDGWLFVFTRRDAGHVKRLIDDWHRTESLKFFEPAALRWAHECSFEDRLKSIRVRRMRARWGSCSHSGYILFNTRLVQAAPELIDYVIVHELCHLKEHNHSERFYSLLDNIMPDWKTRQSALHAQTNQFLTAFG